ncbi:MAG: hypothetical protein AAGI48_15685 [Verrucomicrobiota bacterium]
MIIALCLVGLALGFTARKLNGESPVNESSAESLAAPGEPLPPTRRTTKASPPKLPATLRSQDSLDDLIELDDGELYSRLALWLLDADPGDIAAYWEHHIARDETSRHITDLIMIGWTRKDPEAACAATEGTKYNEFAWWARASHDPDDALQAAIDHTPPKVYAVSWGLGEFHPKWLREYFDLVPEDYRGRALQGMCKWSETDEARAALDFLKTQERRPPAGMMKQIVRQNPWDAYEMIKHEDPVIGEGPMTIMITSMAEEYPEILDRLIAEEPAGPRKLEMENAAFEQLLGTDLDAALFRAKSMEDPATRVEMITKAALKLDREDPEQAFEVAEELFTEDSDALDPNSHAYHLLDRLVRRDPKRLMELIPKTDSIGTPPFHARVKALRRWAELDPEGALGWLHSSGLSEDEIPYLEHMIKRPDS